MRFSCFLFICLALTACNYDHKGIPQMETEEYYESPTWSADEVEVDYSEEDRSIPGYTQVVEGAAYDINLSDVSGDQTMAYGPQEPEVEEKPNIQDVTVGRKLIKEGKLKFKTEDLEGTHSKILAAVKSYGGYCESDVQTNQRDRTLQEMKIRVPAVHFDELVKLASTGINEFETKEISIKDYSEEFTDLSARVKTKKELEKRYLDLLKKAYEVKDVITIENEVNVLRTDIERIQGKLNHLSKRVRLSKLSIRFYEEEEKEKEVVVAENRFVTAFKGGWDIIVGLTVGVVYLWPLILIFLIGFFTFRSKWKTGKAS